MESDNPEYLRALEALRVKHGSLLVRLTGSKGHGPKDLLRLKGRVQGVEEAIYVLRQVVEEDTGPPMDDELQQIYLNISDARWQAIERANAEGDTENTAGYGVQ